ncbi:MAG: hypothetical protein NNA30_02175 [Nitrospira sp.]|nr:hypothetical protein [Nitrospira sp.]
MAMDLLLGVLPDNASVARFRQEGQKKPAVPFCRPVCQEKKPDGERR